MQSVIRFSLVAWILSVATLNWLYAQDPFDAQIASIEISFSEPSWHDTLTARKLRDDKTPVLATVTVEGKEYSNIEVRYKGNSSFHGGLKQGITKLPFRLKCPKGETFEGGYNQLRLSNNFRDPSAVRELLAYRIAGDYVPVPRVVPAVLTVDGEYVGVYTVTEGISDRMIAEYFCNDDGTLVKCEPEFRKPQKAGCPAGEFANLKHLGSDPECYKALYDIESKKQGKAIVDLTKYLKNSSDPGKYINTHYALWMHALNNVMVNLDSYLGIFCHNYYVYRDEYDIFYPLIWDLNLAFGGFATLDNGVTPDLATLSPIAHTKYLEGRRPLIEELTEEQIDRRTYFAMIHTILQEWFISGKYLEEGKRLQEVIRPYYAKEVNPLYPIEDFDANLSSTIKKGENRSVPGIGDLMTERQEYLSRHPLLNRVRPEVKDFGITTLDEGTSVMVVTSPDVVEAYIYVKADECAKWEEFPLEKAGDGKWVSEVIPMHAYYVVVNSEEAVTMSPAAAPMAVMNN